MRSDRYTEQPKNKSRRTLKILLVLILLLAAATSAVVYHMYKSAKDSLEVKFTDDSLSVEFGEEYPAMDYVSDSTGEISVSSEYLEADTLGQKEIVFTAAQHVLGGLLNPTKEFTLSYNVVDTVKPIFLWIGDGTVLERGTEFNINDVLGYGDNADPKPAIAVEGEVDMNTNGRYPLHVTVTDSSGNFAKCDLTVVVADSVPVYDYNPEKTTFKKFVSKHKKDGKSFGIDVSVWQGDVDFDAVKAAGCEFVFIRIGYSTDGEVHPDSKFAQNFENARSAGLKIGIYLYSYDNTEEEVRASAQQIISMLDGESLDYPVVFDWEDFGRFQAYEMSFTDLNNYYDAFADELSGAGYDCMLYSSKNFLEKVWQDTDTRPIWLAHYTDKTDYKGPYRFWQASCTGQIDGIDADVDMDIMR